MSRFNQYREQIDACRAGSDDLALPALAALAKAVEGDRGLAEDLARSQRFDQTVAAAMYDLPVPEGLTGRLLAKLSETGLDEIGVEEAAHEDAANENVALARPQSRITRRVAFAGILATGLLALVALAIQFREQPSRKIAADELTSVAAQWFDEANRPDGWKKLKQGKTVGGFVPPVAGFAPPVAVLHHPKSWRSFKTALGETVVAYDLSPQISRRAVLFVVQTELVYSVQSLPYTKLGTTGTISAAAWQSDGYLYVLVIDNDGQRLDDFLKKPQVTALPWKAAARSA